MTEPTFCEYQSPLAWFGKWALVVILTIVGDIILFDLFVGAFPILAWIVAIVIPICVLLIMIGNVARRDGRCTGSVPWRRF